MTDRIPAEFLICPRKNSGQARIGSTTWRRGCQGGVDGERSLPLRTVRTTSRDDYISVTASQGQTSNLGLVHSLLHIPSTAPQQPSPDSLSLSSRTGLGSTILAQYLVSTSLWPSNHSGLASIRRSYDGCDPSSATLPARVILFQLK